MGKIMRNLSLRYLEQYNMASIVPLEDISYGEEPIDYDYTDEFPPYDTILEFVEKLPVGYCKIFKLARGIVTQGNQLVIAYRATLIFFTVIKS